MLADDLGTERETALRALSRFERACWVKLGPERIQVLGTTALRAVVAGGAEA